MSLAAWPDRVERVAAYLRAAGAEARVEEFADGTPTARSAADAVGATLAQIVKSLVVVCDGAPAIALVPGDRRGDLAKIAAALGGRHARVARADEVEAATGFPPGAVAPFPVPHPVVCDRAVMRHDVVWCGAGSDRHMVGVAPAELLRLSRAALADLARE
jgi:prolyl-tRNA editing enzyme YbaK/EbsC (Cys-tRNA(Pro) deacylase)